MATDKPKGKPRGRPKLYKEEYVEQARKLTKLGATEAELGEFFNVSQRTIRRWIVENAKFARAVKVGKAVADDRVEKSLYNRAVGYTFESEKIFQHNGKVIRAEVLEHVPPETTACIFWLKNRRREEWRDKHELGHSGQVGHGVVLLPEDADPTEYLKNAIKEKPE